MFIWCDSVTFYRAIKSEWQKIQSIIRLYEKASGQSSNMLKTYNFFNTNIDGRIRELIIKESGGVTCGN